jgi:hypothetical protein
MNQVAPTPPSASTESQARAERAPTAFGRRAVRCFVLLIIAVMLIDSAPQSWSWLGGPKRAVSVVLNRIGLWQGEWAMFAPDPVLNNGWFTADIQHTDGTASQLNSPYWIQSSSRDKFLRFRYLNYFNRLPAPYYQSARDDYADYLARKSRVPVESVKLYHTRVRLIMPEDGSLPKRDEADWMFSSEIVAKRTYQPPVPSNPTSQPISDQR